MFYPEKSMKKIRKVRVTMVKVGLYRYFEQMLLWKLFYR